LQPLLAQASKALQGGRHQEAEQLYRAALARDAANPDALHFLGVCLVQTGRNAEGLGFLARSMEQLRNRGRYVHNYALMLAQAGELAAAERELEDAIALEPKNAGSHHYLGMVRHQRGRLEDAVAAYREALKHAPDDAAIASNYGHCLLAQGNIESALDWLRRSIARQPRDPVAHNNLGSALNASGDSRGAIASYRKAIELNPGYAMAWYNLGLALGDVGDDNRSLDAFRNAVRTGPAFAPAWEKFADAFGRSRFIAWDAQAAQELTRVLLHPTIDAAGLSDAAASLLVLDPAFGPLFREAPAATWFSGERLRALANPMLLALIENALLPDHSFEIFLQSVRRRALEAWDSGALLASPTCVELLCALAQQCFLNEYVWPESNEETAQVDRLVARVGAAGGALEVALLGAYRPLARVANLARPAPDGEAFERLWRRQVDEPRTEAALQAEIPALTPIQDQVSHAVQRQYEENPYPRWHRVPASLAAPFPARQVLRTLFPQLDMSRLRVPDAPHILIAGCGTGYQAAVTAARNPGSRILAVDLSRTSLAYAMRRCRELRSANIRFAQADILQLDAIPERFEVIECAGVLHHLREPLDGWRVLASLLKAGGVMKLGLYSEIARRGVVAARELIARRGLHADLAGIRAARQLVLAQPEGSAERTVAHSYDFYCASGARDLMLHVQEHRYTTAQLAAAIRALGLEFLGFEAIDPRAVLAYRERFPADHAAASLENWGRFEEEFPDTFAGMYQFWVSKPI
jgi:tetratricopeptide (TPR) repeat protein/SAM-dependent methyltransferase